MRFALTINGDDSSSVDGRERVANHIARAVAARENGFEMISVGHRYSFGPALEDERGESFDTSRFQPLLLLAHVAAVLGSEVKYLTQVLVSSGLHPVQLAEDIATLDTLTGGGLSVGIGMGWQPYELEAFEIEKLTRVKRFEELVTLLRALMTSDSVTFNGTFFDVQSARVAARGIQKPHPPLWLGASVEAAVRRAARLGDTWTMSGHHQVSELASQLAIYREERAKLGLPLPEDRPIIRQIYIAEDREVAFQEAEPIFAEHYRRRGATGWFLANDRKWKTADLGAMHFVVGNPDDVIAQITNIQETLDANILTFTMPQGSSQEARLRVIKLLGKDVIPHFKGR